MATTISNQHLRKQIYIVGFVYLFDTTAMMPVLLNLFSLLSLGILNIMTMDMVRPRKHHMRLMVRLIKQNPTYFNMLHSCSLSLGGMIGPVIYLY